MMQHGWLKTAVATPKVKVANCPFNAAQTISMIQRAKEEGVRLLILPELGLTGYSCGDLFFLKTLQQGAMDALEQVRTATEDWDGLVLVGMPLSVEQKLYNCALVVQRGVFLGAVPKSYLPNHNEFSEPRQFTEYHAENITIDLCGQKVPFGSKLLFACKEMPELVLGVELCEDLWAVIPPSSRHVMAGATVIANLSAGTEGVGKPEERRRLVQSQSARGICGYLLAGAGWGESTTDAVYGGHSLIAENGVMLAESALFSFGMVSAELDLQRMVGERQVRSTFRAETQSDYQTVSFSMPLCTTTLTRAYSPTPFVPAQAQDKATRFSYIFQMLSHALAKRMEHTHCKTLVLGLSGGLDSTLALLVAKEAFRLTDRPMTDLLAVSMPCFGTSERTRQNARLLAEGMGVTFREIDITDSVRQHFADIGHDEQNHNVVYENAQARERAQVLMDLSNACGGFVLGTGDLSESALGWCTYNADHISMYHVNAGVPKTLVRHLVAYYAETVAEEAQKAVLTDILGTPISPELLPPEAGKIAQKTEDLVGPYELHDFYLYYLLRCHFAPDKLLRLARHAFGTRYTDDELFHWLTVLLRRFFSQQFKRSCMPDAPKIGSVSLSPRTGWQMPSDAEAQLWLEELAKLRQNDRENVEF